MVNCDEEDSNINNDHEFNQGNSKDQEYASSGALANLTEHVLTTNTNTLLQFFEFHGIEEIDDFMSFDEIDLNKN
jgi:hypothetical protein